MELKMNASMYKVGIYALLGSAVLTSISQVFYAHHVQSVHPFLFTGISFLITALYFQLFAATQKMTVHWATDKKPLFKLNIASALTFLSFYFALKYVEPAIVSALEMGVAPLFLVVLLLLQRQKISKRKWLISIGTLAACLLLIWAVFSGASGIGMMLSFELLLGIFASIVAGIGAVFCSEYSKELSNRGWSSSMILAKRYIAIIIISIGFTYDIIIPYFMDNIVWILLVTVGGVLLPNYLLQKGIQYTNTFLVMMSLSFIPVLTFFFQLFDTRIQFSVVTCIGVLLLFLCGCSSLQEEQHEKAPHLFK